jgi:hypothetical protein
LYWVPTLGVPFELDTEAVDFHTQGYAWALVHLRGLRYGPPQGKWRILSSAVLEARSVWRQYPDVVDRMDRFYAMTGRGAHPGRVGGVYPGGVFDSSRRPV